MTENRGSAAGRWVMGVIGIAITLVLLLAFGYLVPNFKIKAREAQTKQNLHTIQLALERYAGDQIYGTYPAWILGGSLSNDPGEQLDDGLAADPLLREGYLTSYPRNPFARSTHQQKLLAMMQEDVDDPFRPGRSSVVPPGFRFGEQHGLMGVVFATKAARTTLDGNTAGTCSKRLTGMDTVYPVLEATEWNESSRWLQGQFYYATAKESVGSYKQSTPEQVAWLRSKYALPDYPGSFSLGVFGAFARKHSVDNFNTGVPGNLRGDFPTGPWQHGMVLWETYVVCNLYGSFGDGMLAQYEAETGDTSASNSGSVNGDSNGK